VDALAGRQAGLRIARNAHFVIEGLDQDRVFTTRHRARTVDLALILASQSHVGRHWHG